ncbi:MAG: hypothetical protein HYR84_13525, partial [Planctomycetes bacterium]|nr:hypothetical protein [Planctomycetota bacterium]
MTGTHGANEKRVGRRSAVVIALCVIAWGVSAAASFSQGSPPRALVANVHFDGAPNIPVDKLMNFVHTRPGREYSTSVAYEDISRLAASRLCKPVDVRTETTSDGRVNVIFVVREFRSVVREVAFRHAKHVTVKELEGIVPRIRRGMPLDPTMNQLACFEIQEHLSGTFNPRMVDSDVFKIEEYYRNNGYLKAHVSRELQFSDDFKFVDIIFHIQEGVRYRVDDWVIAGGSHFRPGELDSIITIKKREYFNANDVNTNVGYLTAYSGWRGYQTDVKMNPSEVPGESGLVRMRFEVDERPIAYAGE